MNKIDTAAKRILNDCTNAEVFVLRQKSTTKYSPKTKSWYLWDGKKWHQDEENQIIRYAIETTKEIREVLEEEGVGASLVKKAESHQNLSRLKALIEIASTDPSIQMDFSCLDKNPLEINAQNGIVSLKDGSIRPHDKEAYMAHLLDVEYDPDAKSPLWDSVVQEVFLKDEELIHWVQKAIGYSITGSTEEQKFFICHGPTASNGKSTFLHGVKHMLGPRLGQQADFSTFRQSNKRGGASPEIVRMRNARMIVAAEGEEGKKLSEQLLKVLTGNESLVGRELYKDYIEFKAKGKMWLSSNFLPKIDGLDEGMWRRVEVVPFKRIFTYEEMDRKIFEKLERKEVQQAILAWCVKGAINWNKESLGTCKQIEDAKAAYRDTQRELHEFSNSMISPSPEGKVSKKSLYDIYIEWCKHSAETPLGKHAFNKLIAALPGVTQIKQSGYLYWRGIKVVIREDDHEHSG